MSQIINLTPHPITVGSTTIAPTLPPARAGEWVQAADPITMSIPDPHGAPADRIEYAVPTSWVTYIRLEDLPDPAPDTYYVVSLVVAQAAAACHRTTADLLTPGEQIRDDKGRIIGCKSLARVGRGIPVYRWHDQREAFVAECIRQGGSSDVSAEREVGNLGRYPRNYAGAELREPATITARPGDLVTFYCATRKGRGVHLTGVPFGTRDKMDAAYALLARAGATCNDARPAEREIAAMSPEDRAVAQRVADLDEIEPAEGYEERAVERARRDGVL